MAIKIPRQERQVLPQEINVPMPQAPAPMQGAFGENVVQAQGGIAEATSQLADVLGKRALQKQKNINDRYFLDMDTQFKKAVNQKLYDDSEEEAIVGGQKVKRKRGLLRREGTLASGSVEEFDQWANKYISGMLSSANTDEIRNRLMQSSGNLAGSVRGNIIQHEVKQDNLVTQTAYEANMTAIAEDDAQYATNGGLPELLDLLTKTSDEYALSRGLTDDNVKNELAKKYIDTAVDTALATAFAEDPNGVKAFMVLEGVKNKITNYEEKKQSMIKMFDKQKAVENFALVLKKNSVDDELKTLLANNELDMTTLNTIRDANPFTMDDTMYNKYKEVIENAQTVFGTGNPQAGYEILNEFSNLWKTLKASDLKKQGKNKKFDDNLKLRARVLDGVIAGDIDGDMQKVLNPLFEATTTENVKFSRYYAPYLEALEQVETFSRKMRVQEMKFTQAYGEDIEAGEEIDKALIYNIYSQFLKASPGGEKKLEPVKTTKDAEILRQKLNEVLQVYSAETARRRYNITADEEGNEYVSTPDGASYKVNGYSYGVPLLNFDELKKDMQ